jgi:restriction endonuclease S subunit
MAIKIFTDNRKKLSPLGEGSEPSSSDIIAEIRHFKMWLMQDFLAGKGKLPEFNDNGLANSIWPPSDLGNVSDIKKGPENMAIYDKYFDLEGIPVIETASVQSLKMNTSECRRVRSSALNDLPDFTASGGDIIFVLTGDFAGASAIMPIFCGDGMLGPGCLKIRVYSPWCEAFYLLNLLHYYFNAGFFGGMNFSIDDTRNLTVPLPPVDKQKAVTDELLRLSGLMETKEEGINEMSKLTDFLLK